MEEVKREMEVVNMVQVLQRENLEKVHYLEDFSLKRSPGGVMLSVKSLILSELMERFKAKGRDNQRTTKWVGDTYIPLSEDFQNPIKGATFQELGAALFLSDQIVNLSFLRAVHLAEGVKLQINGVMSASYCQDFVVAAMDKMETLFLKHCKPFSVGGKLYVEVR